MEDQLSNVLVCDKRGEARGLTLKLQAGTVGLPAQYF